MSDNMSQNTEKDFLDQTFKDIDSAVSIDEGQEGAAQEEKKPAQAKKAGVSKNTIIIGGVAFVAVAAVGWMYLTAQPGQAPTQPVQVQEQAPLAPEQAPVSFNDPNANPSANSNAPSSVPEVPNLTEVAPVAPIIPQEVSPLTMPDTMPELSMPSVEPTQPTSQEVNSVLADATMPVQTSVDPIVQVPTVSVPVVAAVPELNPVATISSNAVQTASVDELRGLFDKHSIEIDKLDIRVTALEAKFDQGFKEQQEVNKKVEARLAQLEKGGVQTSRSSSASANSNNRKAANVNSGNTQRKRVKKVSSSASTSSQSSTIIVNNKPETLESMTLIDKRDRMVAKPKQEAIEVHSVFSGRLWIKNADSTLSTFSVGESIPGGEKIKRIDEEGKKIYTDKRVINY